MGGAGRSGYFASFRADVQVGGEERYQPVPVPAVAVGSAVPVEQDVGEDVQGHPGACLHHGGGQSLELRYGDVPSDT